MPFAVDEVRYSQACGRDADGHPRAWIDIRIRAAALRRLGLHPDQPTSVVTAPSPPGWWHAAAERARSRGKY
ncbi:hypothetical protein ODJ79_20195 [Actinoplanes sp. KI2]|uniref:hypothetical protein n=1 Tax=Actinoplanes sp. KI2 TaxID=2983315 RepID=UPI0021D5FEF7|nr:hypothetical protein [Actinoplanes sp. KI2]MCU7726052.1 hypothetical protein [Actinoplanes sp. KI2]